jgi:hypothetical protein
MRRIMSIFNLVGGLVASKHRKNYHLKGLVSQDEKVLCGLSVKKNGLPTNYQLPTSTTILVRIVIHFTCPTDTSNQCQNYENWKITLPSTVEII